MDTKAVQEKLQNAYRSMLEDVEELVDKEKKPIKEAFAEAEEKLSEWKELSREEIDHISAELKSNLKEIGEVSNYLNESLNETLKVDAAYIASNFWETLSNIVDKAADKTIIELSEFNENLQQKTVTDESNYSAQQKHLLDDAQSWLADYENSLSQLTEIRSNIRKQMREVKSYRKSIEKDQAKQSQHDLLAQLNQQSVEAIKSLHKLVLQQHCIDGYSESESG